MTSTEYKEQLSAALRKIGGTLPLGFEYTRLTGENAPIGGVDYMGQTATRAMYADLWAWLNKHKPDAIVSESEWQSLYSSQNGNVAKYSTGDGSTTFRFPRVVGYFKGADAVSKLGEYVKEGLPNIKGTWAGVYNSNGLSGAVSGSFSKNTSDPEAANVSGSNLKAVFDIDASRSNPIYGNSQHVTPETVTVVMGVIAFGSVASIGTATEEGIVAELSEHRAKLDELGAQVDELEGSVANSVPAGFVMPFAANSTPSGYLLCNGAAVSRTTYSALFSAIGTIYGTGDGSTTFNLPDLRGRYIEGQHNHAVGTYWNPGLPNITGQFVSFAKHSSFPVPQGAFYDNGAALNDNLGYSRGGSGSYYAVPFKAVFDASRSSSIYGASSTVQPPAVTMRYYIKY